MNCVVLMGRLYKDVDYKQNGEKSLAKFGVAVDRKFKNAEGKYEADFINCTAFNKTADFIAQYFKKGMRICLSGRIQTGNYQNKEGTTVYTTDVIVDNAEFCEKKSDNAPAQQNTAQSNEDGFMNVPTSIDEELPFV